MPSDEVAQSHVNFKFKKAKLDTMIQRLKLIQKLDMVKGPVFIIFKLK